MKKKQKKQLHQLYVELVKLQKTIIASKLKLLIILEGRDAAGKDGTVKRIIKHLSPRETRVVALGKPSNYEKNQWYFQRYTEHLPGGGEFVIFNRSWYNRAGVEKVMNFCTSKQYHVFFDEVELFEKMLTKANVIIIKYYLDISREEQHNRLDDRKTDPLKQWKISPIDQKAQKLWDEYSEARNYMLSKTDFNFSPWYIANAESKNELHIALITHLLSLMDYKDKKLPKFKKQFIFPVKTNNLKNTLYK